MKNIFIIFALFFIQFIAFGVELENKFVKLIVSDKNSRFRIETIEGNDLIGSDNHKKIMYPSETSITTLKIDENLYIYGSEDGKFIQKPFLFDDKTILSEWLLNNITITQKISISQNPLSTNLDLVKVEYSVKNNSSTNHKIGVRILIDTLLGDNDGAAFKIPKNDNLTTEKELFDYDIPQYWYCFDSFKNPKVFTYGQFKGENITKPDRIIFGRWNALFKNIWNYSVNTSAKVTGDSAIAIYFDNENISTNEEKIFNTSYGVYGAKFNFNEIVSLLAGVVPEVEEYPFLLSANIYNESPVKLKNLSLKIDLPEGFYLDNMHKDQNNLYYLNLGEYSQDKKSWYINYKEEIGLSGGEYEIPISLTFKNKDKEETIKEVKKIKIKSKPDITSPFVYLISPTKKINKIASIKEEYIDVEGFIYDNISIKDFKINGENITFQKEYNVGEMKDFIKKVSQKRIKNTFSDFDEEIEQETTDEDLENIEFDARNQIFLMMLSKVNNGKIKYFKTQIKKEQQQFYLKLFANDYQNNETKIIIVYK
ncbi:MAG: hypothetical protein A2Y34_05150 [Spirochaetes bacterium GWC1_27_15]|nr:MAG: hypothetical protein A2Y34_05150 [Spirochaetes bacterium GWC1_27_15]